MPQLQWWMRIVGVLQLFIAGALLPFGTGPGKALEGVPFNQQFAQRMEDWMFFAGLDSAVLGAVLLYAAGRPRDHPILIWLVVGLAGVRGVFGGFYYLYRGAIGFGWWLLPVAHLFIMLTGIHFARQMRASGRR